MNSYVGFGRTDISMRSTMKRYSILAASAIMAITMLAPVASAAETDSDVVLNDSDLADWTEPTETGSGPVPVEPTEEAELGAVPFDFGSSSASLLHASDIVVTGSGWSHGVGLSQYGALAQALADRDYSTILASYFPGTSLTKNVPAENFWVNLEQEAVKIVLTAKQIRANPTPVTVTRGSESVTLGDGESVTVEYTGLVGGIRECTFSSGSFSSVTGPCNIDVEWDGFVASPSMRVVIDKVWYYGTGAAGKDCVHSVGSTTLECAYSRGEIHIRPDDNDEPSPGDIGFHTVLEIDRDDYILGIGESPHLWPSETNKVQAVTSRSFAAWVSDLRGAPENRQWCWCNLYDQFPDQVYLGWGFGISKWVNAVRATDGEILTYGGKPAAAFFGSSVGGFTENNEDIWNGAPIDYLRANPDVWSLSTVNPYRTWDVGVSASTFASVLGFSSVSSVEVVDRFESGTPSDVIVKGTSGGSVTTKHFTGVEIQSRFNKAAGVPTLRSPHINQITGIFAPNDAKVDRWGGGDRYETAVAVSWANFSSGVPAVVVVRGDLFPDALSAASLATGVDGPVLLTKSTSLPGIVAEEINRLNPATIYVVGGSAAVSDSVLNELSTYAPVVRLWGQNRYGTAVDVSKEIAPSGADTVFIGSGVDFAETVAGSGLAAAKDAPLLLTRTTGLPSETRKELNRLKPAEIVVVGGTDVVSNAVVNDLKKYANKVTRLSGGDRYGTSAAISKWGYPSGTDRAFVAVGTDYADALAGAAIAGIDGGPILFVTHTSVPSNVAAELARLGADHISILGGPAAVSYGIQDAVDDF
jgi:SpoIID/LytB domain protein